MNISSINNATTLATTLSATSSTTTITTTAAPTKKAVFTGMEINSIVFFSMIMFLGVLGNALVIFVYGFSSKKRFLKFERLILILAIVDLLASIMNPAVYIYFNATHHQQWHFGEVGCKVIPAVGPILTNISLGIILIMAIDRDRAVSTPFKKQFNLSVIYKAIGATVLLSILSFVPYIVYLKQHPPYGFCRASDSGNKVYNKLVICMLCISDGLFLFIFVFSSVRVYTKLKAKTSVSGNGDNTGACINTGMALERQKETNRIIRLIFAMGIMFFICIYPRDLLHICYNFAQVTGGQLNLKVIVPVNSNLKLLHTANSVVNVFLYSFLNSHFRKEVLKLMGKCRMTRFFMKTFKVNSMELQSGNTGSTAASESQSHGR